MFKTVDVSPAYSEIIFTDKLKPFLIDAFDKRRGFLMVIVPKEQIIAGDITPIFCTLKELIASPKVAKSFRGKVEILFDGYDYDSRELYQIAEVRAYVHKLDAAFPYWFYFLSKQLLGLQALLLCLLPPNWEKSEASVLFEEKDKIVWNWFAALNKIDDFIGRDDEMNQAVTAESMAYINKFFKLV